MSDLAGKTALVSGATSGIGYHTALALAQRGAHVIIGARNQSRGAAAVGNIQRQYPDASVEYLAADLSDMDQVRFLTESFKQSHSRLDILVNNAGGFFLRRERSVDGYEKTFALNHLSYHLLTNLLLGPLQAAAPARVVNVASVAHRSARIHFDDLQLSRGYGLGWKAYGQSKLANVLFSYELARRLEDSGVTSNALHPGFVRTGLPTKHMPWPLRIFGWISFLWGMPPEQGAKTSVHLASDAGLGKVTGKYFRNLQEVRSSPLSYDQETAARLWQVSNKLVGLA